MIQLIDGILTTITEIVCVLLIRDKLIQKDIKRLNRKDIVFVVFISILTYVTDYYLHNFEFILDTLLLTISIWLIYKIKLYNSITQIVIATITFTVIEFISVLPFVFVNELQNSILVKYSSLFLSIVMSIICYCKADINRIYEYINNSKNNILRIIVINSFLAIFSVWVYWNNNFDNKLFGLIYFILILLLILIVNVLIIFYIDKSNRQLKIIESYNKYNPFIDELIKEIRRKQHEYENRLQAFSALPEVCATYDELVENINKHTSEWNQQLNSINANILKLKYKILAALIYSKMKIAEKKDIKFTCNIDNINVEYPMKEYELIDVIGILIDNAIEAVESYEKSKKIIILFFETDTEKHIVVKNTYNKIKEEHFNKFFTKSFSTKGSQRGFGLYNLNKILSKNNNVEIKVANEKLDNQNYVVFDLVFSLSSI